MSAAGRVPPSNLDAEAAVLSACLLSAEALDEVADLVRPAHFYAPANRLVFEAFLALQSAGTPVDVVSVKDWLRGREMLQQVGGAAYLAQLVDATPSVAHVRDHAEIIVRLARVRGAIDLCHRGAADGYESGACVDSYLDGLEAGIYALRGEELDRGVVPIAESLRETVAAMTDSPADGRPTGFTGLDEATGGLRGGELWILAARPGMGKTSFAVDIARGVVGAGDAATGVAIFSLEMPRRQIDHRLLAAEACVDLRRLRQHAVRESEWVALTAAAARIAAWQLWVDDSPGLSLVRLRSRARRAVRAGAGVVIVDYLQLMSAERGETRDQEVSSLTRGLKNLARDLGVPVIVLSQLNRQVEQRRDKRPTLADLRESGAIEQDADVVLFLYRPGYYLRLEGKVDNTNGSTELIIAKQRNGPTGVRALKFSEYTASFAEGERGDDGDRDWG